MSTSASISSIQELRQEVIKFNAEARLATHIAQDGQLALRDFVTIVRMLTGGDPQLSNFLLDMQAAIAIAQTARIALKALQIEMGPVGWVFLIGGTFAGMVGMEQMMRRPG